MSDKMIFHAPIDIELKIHVTDGENEGVVTYTMPAAKFPTIEDLQKAIIEAEKSVKETAGEDFRLMNKQEWFDQWMRQKTGINTRFAIPGGKDWDRP